MPEIRIAFKAGRAFRREGTNFVDPSPTKGAIIVQNGEDELLHFIWKNRVTNEEEEDLILLPSDASFTKVTQSTWGRTFVLKFSSSGQSHFFWMQDADTSRDVEFVENVNRLLADPSDNLVWSSTPTSSSNPAPAASNAASSSAASTSRSGGFQLTQEQLEQFRNIVASSSARPPQQPEFSLTDILTPTNLAPLFKSHPELIQPLFPHLPPDLPTPPSQEALQQIIASPQFRAAVRNLDQALRTGLLGGLVRGLGLPEEAGTSVEAFLRAIQEQASREGEGGERMDTD